MIANKKTKFQIYQDKVKEKIDYLTPFLQKAALGDFKRKIKIPKKEDEFTELLISINLMIEDLKDIQKENEENFKKVKKSNEHCEKEIIKRTFKLEANEKKFKDIVDSMSDWIWETNEKGIYTYVSDRVEDILGYKPEEIIGKTPLDFMTKKEATRVGKKFKIILSKKLPIENLENLNLHRNGKEVYLLTNAIPILDNKGKLLGYRGTDNDITTRKTMEINLKKQLQQADSMNKLMIGRELKMIELKEEIRRLKK